MSADKEAILGLVRVGYQIELVDLFAMAYLSSSDYSDNDEMSKSELAEYAYDVAEAMIAERERRFKCRESREQPPAPLSPDVPLFTEDDCPF